MDSTTLFYCIIGILLADYLLDTVLGYLNYTWYKKPVPPSLEDVYNPTEYEKSQSYKATTYKFGILIRTLTLIGTLAFLFVDGFAILDNVARGFSTNPVVMALVFFGIITVGSMILSLPLEYYATFVIEQRFGFNKMTVKTFVLDKLKGLLLAATLGAALLSVVVLCYQWAGANFWWYVWLLITAVSLFINMFYARLIVPLFNKQKPLESGLLKDAIAHYTQSVGFKLDNIFVIDGSKRSTKANAYFSGMGSEKRVTLYDTLIDTLSQEEIVAVLAHEVGHYKRKHIIYNIIAGIVTTGFTLWLFSLFVDSALLSSALGVGTPSFHIGLIAFGLLYAPISMVTGIVMSSLSRKHEYQADQYASQTYRNEPLITALKKLSKDSLSNLTPHPAYEFFNYSHPSLYKRIAAMRA